MKNRTKKNWQKGKRIKSATSSPIFILRTRGVLDAKKESVPEAYTEMLLKALAAIESNEVLVAERLLTSTRSSAIAALNALTEAKALSPGSSRISDLATESEIRAVRQAHAKENAIITNARLAKEALPALKETIIETHSILDQRIEKARAKSMKKIIAYIFGVRKGGRTDFSISFDISDDARRLYYKHHARLDNLIDQAVYTSLDPKTDPENEEGEYVSLKKS